VIKLRAALIYTPGKPFVVEEVEVPKIRSNEVLVRVRACGICHGDAHTTHEGMDLPKKPMIMGHEIAGDIAEVGEAVSGFKQGERVLVWHYQACGICEHCRSGNENLCDNLSILGMTTDGGYAEYVKATANSLVRLPDELPYDACILPCAGLTAFHAVRDVARVAVGENVVIMGVGGVGLSILQWAKLSGARVIGVDVIEEKLKEAVKLGADDVINATKQEVQKEIMKLTNGKGAEVIFELVGLPQTMENSLNSLAKRGKYVFIGYHAQHNFNVHPLKILGRELKILGSRSGTKKELEKVVDLTRAGKFKLLVTKTVTLEELNQTLDQVYHGEIFGRAIVKP